MRPAKPPILWTLWRVWRVWRRCPEQRLGQLIDNAQCLYPIGGANLFAIHDEDLVDKLEWFVWKYKPPHGR